MSSIESAAALPQGQHYFISPMTEHDLLEVVEIEESSGLSLWGWDSYHQELTGPNRALMFVARALAEESPSTDRRIKGFIAARIVADELHVNNVAVRQQYRREGIGRMLLEVILKEGRKLGAVAAFLEVRASNEPAQSLYLGSGFRAVGLRRDYYSDPAEDALIMRHAFSASA